METVRSNGLNEVNHRLDAALQSSPLSQHYDDEDSFQALHWNVDLSTGRITTTRRENRSMNTTRYSHPSSSVLRACLFALVCLTFSSVGGYASPQPSEADNVHFCLPIDFEEMRESDSLYAARKQAFDLNVGESRTVRMIYFLPNDRPVSRRSGSADER